MARVVVHYERIDEIDPEPLLRKLAEDVVEDAKRLVKKDTHRTEESIHVDSVDPEKAVVVADPARRQKKGEEHYAYWLEKGTSDTEAQPFMRPAVYKRRNP